MQRDVPSPTPASSSPSPSAAPASPPQGPTVNANTTAALVPQARLTGEAFASFADFSEDLEPTRAMIREDIPNEPMPLARRATKSHPSPSTAPHDTDDEPLYPEAATPEVVDFNERMKSEPPTQVVPAPRVSKFVAPPIPAPTPPPAAGARASVAPAAPAARPAPAAAKPAPPAKPLPPKPARPPASSSTDEANRATVDSTSGAVVPLPAPAPTPAPAAVAAAAEPAEARPPRSSSHTNRRDRSDRGQTGALVFLGVCAIAAAGLIGLSVGRSTAPQPMQGTAAAGDPAGAAAPHAVAAAVTTAQGQGVVAQPGVAATAVAPGATNTAVPAATAPTAAAGPATTSKTSTTTRSADRAGPSPSPEPKPAADSAGAGAAVPSDGVAAPPFDAASATSALAALTGAVQSCGDGAGGTARVAVTFSPSGRVTQAIVEGAPYAGTPAGGCIAAKARGASVPAFSGSPTTVRKTYTMN